MTRRPLRPDPTRRPVCKDCLAEADARAEDLRRPRPAPHPGPRCATHHRAKRKADKTAAHDQRIVRTYTGMKPGDYDKILAEQDGLCAICGPATGARGLSRKLALDHDHLMDWPYGLLCGRCNEYLGYILRSVNTAQRLVSYLTDPPAWRVIGPPPGHVPRHDRPLPGNIEALRVDGRNAGKVAEMRRRLTGAVDPFGCPPDQVQSGETLTGGDLTRE